MTTPKPDQTEITQSIDEKLFGLLVANVKDCAIYMIDANGYILTWNQGAEHITGYAESEITGEHIAVFYTEEDKRKNIPRKDINEALRTNKCETTGWRVKKNGVKFWANVTFNTVYNENDHLVGFAVLVSDVSSRKHTDEINEELNAELEKRIADNTKRIIDNELRFRKLIENSSDGITLFDRQFHAFFRSRSSERINGWNNVDRAGYETAELVHPDDREKVQELFAEILSRPGMPVMSTYRTKHRLGHYIWTECLFTNMLYDETVRAIVCNFRDVTQKVEADKEIRKKTKQVENILESITDGFIALDNNLCYTYANKKIGEMTGIDPDYLIGKNVWEIFPDAVESKTFIAFNRALSTRKYICQEDYYAPLNLWQENHIYPSENGLSVFISDISNRKKAEEQIREKTTQIESILESISDGFVTFDRNLCFTYANKKISEMIGYPAESIIGKNVWEAFPGQVGSETDKALNKALKEQKYVCHEDYYEPTHLWQENHIYPSPNGLSVFVRDITERKKAEQVLKQSEQRFRALLENSSDMLTVSNLEGIITYISPNVKKIMGYDAREFNTARKGIEFFHPDEHEYHQEISAKLRQNPGEIYPFVNRLKHANGQWIWVEGTVTNLLHVPAVNGVVTNFRDISERKKNEQQLIEASEMQASILNALPPHIALLNEQGKIIAVNRAWRKFAFDNNLGVPNFGVGYNYLSVAEKATGIDAIGAKKLANGIKDVAEGRKKEFSLEYSSNLSKEKSWYQVIIAPLADKSNKGVVIAHINITDRKKAQESLYQSEANLRSVFENTDLSIILFDNDLKTIAFNNNAKHNMLRNLGKKLKIGATVFTYFPKKREPVIRQAIERVKNHEMVIYETVYEFTDGSLEWYEVKWMQVLNRHGKIIGAILTFNNITARKNADMEREKITADLVRRNSDLEQFTYIVSHNLRAPVANIQGLANLLMMSDNADKDEDIVLINSLSASANSLDSVIHDLNSILQTGHVSDNIELVSLPAVVEEVSAEIKMMIAKNGAMITTDFNDVSELYTLKGYIYSIFHNLIVNGIKYRRPAVTPIIQISTKITGDHVAICFKDNGKGIDLLKYDSHLFGLYKRFDYSVEGKGMGLFMVKTQVESLGGNITVKSELQRGTEFTIHLPLRK